MYEFSPSRAEMLQAFVDYRTASDRWNFVDDKNLHYFDRFCTERFPDTPGLTQEMVDSWSAKRPTKTGTSCYGRAIIIVKLVEFLSGRGMLVLNKPELPKPDTSRKYVPHTFSEDELKRFFNACDTAVSNAGSPIIASRRLAASVFFRLIYSTGMRTVEARLLQTENVDLTSGVIDIKRSKGRDQHYVVLHDTMLDVMRNYDSAIKRLYTDRVYFFAYTQADPFYREWAPLVFRDIWDKVNTVHAVPYDLRHNYATQNINSRTDRGFGFSDKFIYLSKSMGHKQLESTRYYYSLVPSLAQTMEEQTMDGFNDIIPEVDSNEEAW